MITDTLGIWLNIIMTLACISFAFKHTPLYRFAESTVIGVGIGNVFVLAMENIQKQAIAPLSQGAYLFVIPFVLGLLLYSRFYAPMAWLSRYPVMILLGIGTGLAVRGAIPAQIIAQIKVSLLPLVAKDPMTSINNILITVLLASTLIFFIFTWEPKGDTGKNVMGYIRRLGRITVMIYLGSAFSSAAMARVVVMAERLLFMLKGIGFT